MKPELIIKSTKAAIDILQSIGYDVEREKGKHICLRNIDKPKSAPIIIPNARSLKPEIFERIIRSMNHDNLFEMALNLSDNFDEYDDSDDDEYYDENDF